MTDADDERFAGIVADHVVMAIERWRDGERYPEDQRRRAIAELMREMLADMPTTSGRVLAQACNRVLSGLPDRGFIVPQVQDVDMGDSMVMISPTI